MAKKKLQDRKPQSNWWRNSTGPLPSHVFDCFDGKRIAQREEFFSNLKGSQRFRQKKQNKTKLKPMTFDQKLNLTEQWFEETFPHLFAADDYMALDYLILCDLKNDYRNNFLKKGYPQYLVIKAALNRYKESYGYLWNLKEGASRYNLKGEICGIVTKEEEEAAKKILATL
jgi:hypothetical protein